MSFVFFDIETTGTNRVFDQILQFAAVRAKEDFKDLDQINLRCQLLPHVVPSPEAMRVTGVTAAQLLDAGLPTHYAMIPKGLARLFSWSPALYIGYNSMEFDEHLLRQALYQTLHPPYFTNSDGNCRADALRLVRMVALFAPDILRRPVDENGNEVFKLELLARANGYEHGNAHDAMADVRSMGERASILDRIEDRRLRQLGRRLTYLERPDVLSPELVTKMNRMVADRVIHGDGQDTWLCLEPAIRRLDELMPGSPFGQAACLAGHRQLLVQRLAELKSRIA